MSKVPMRWPSSPREHWTKPDSLQVLSGTPINCIVLRWEADQQVWQPLAERARSMGITVLGEGRRPVQGAAVSGLLTSSPSVAGDVPLLGQAQITPNLDAPVIALNKGTWPSIRTFGRGDGASAGPTGAAWVESNGWLARLAHQRAPGKEFWLTYTPPAKTDTLRPDSYVLAVADAAAYGAKWLVSLDEGLSAGLVRGDSAAAGTWKRLAGAIAFFEKHSGWNSFQPASNAGVLSDFAGPNEHFACEVIKLADRRSHILRALFKHRAAGESYDGLKGIIYSDRTPPDAALAKKLSAFVDSGGLVVGPPALRDLVPTGATVAETFPRHTVFLAGKGRYAIAIKDPTDPYLLGADTHLILSRKHDLLRVWNGGSMNVHLTSAPDKRKALVQVLNYSLRAAGHEPSVQVSEPYRTARLLKVDSAAEETLAPAPATPGIEIHLPAIPVYAAIELSK